MDSQIIPHEGNKRLGLIENALSIQQVLDQRKLVMQVMRDAMQDGLHFGKIPGCGDKPTLLQPGAQMLCSVFCLTDSLEMFATDLAGGHREYRVTCTIIAPNGQKWQGVGLATSMETKHRYRNSAAQVEDTGDALPKSYWDWKEADPKTCNAKLAAAYDGARVGPKKFPEGWRVVRYIGGDDGKIENPNPADCFNTVLKMAKKRAYVDATITATACNDLFTQDLEDIRENLTAIEAQSEVTREPQQERRERDPDVSQDHRDSRERTFPEPDARGASSQHRQPDAPTIANKTAIGGLKVEDVNVREGFDVTKKSDTLPKGKPWKKFGVKLSNGITAGTFSETLGQIAINALASGGLVTVTLQPGNKAGYTDLVNIEQE